MLAPPATRRRPRRRRRVPPRDADRPRRQVHDVPAVRGAARGRRRDRRRRIRSLLDGEQPHRRPRHRRHRPHGQRARGARTRSVWDGPHTRRDRAAGVRRRRLPRRPPLVHVRLQRPRPPRRRGVAVGADRSGADHRRCDAGQGLGAEVVIVSMHWGVEGQRAVTPNSGRSPRRSPRPASSTSSSATTPTCCSRSSRSTACG